ncbi:S-adenosylmethionine synthetase 1 [Actinidia rufa]|uniref:S-adenosylmethionine synthetase 1 n=1 Tax=Actinidia rufa TaxID=165716 RepID=A0A7J0E0C8_9ERIC|nr:S-adenosylmethionine synthetase 1 [Actinidia rufa]
MFDDELLFITIMCMLEWIPSLFTSEYSSHEGHPDKLCDQVFCAIRMLDGTDPEANLLARPAKMWSCLWWITTKAQVLVKIEQQSPDIAQEFHGAFLGKDPTKVDRSGAITLLGGKPRSCVGRACPTLSCAGSLCNWCGGTVLLTLTNMGRLLIMYTGSDQGKFDFRQECSTILTSSEECNFRYQKMLPMDIGRDDQISLGGDGEILNPKLEFGSRDYKKFFPANFTLLLFLAWIE